MIDRNIQKGTEVIQEPVVNQLRWFKITYSFYNKKNQYQERMLQMIGLSLADCQGEIQKSVGGREVNILSHNSGRPINFISQAVLRILIKKNLKWFNTEKAQADRQTKIDKMKASQSAKVERALDGVENADITKKLQAAHNKSKYIG